MGTSYKAWSAAFALASQFTMPAFAADTLPATSPWMIRYDEDRCSAVREFGSGKTLHVLWLDQFGSNSAYNLTLLGPAAKSISGESVQIRFGEEPATRRSYVRTRSRDGKPVIVFYGAQLAPPDGRGSASPTPMTAQREAAVDRIAISGGGIDLVLQTGSMGASLAELHKCANDLEEYLQEPRSRQATPKGNVGEWLTDADYPSSSVRTGQEGVVKFRLMVDAAGVPSACQIIESTRSDAFDDVSCVSLMKRARFQPALDMAGKPVASTFTSSIRFQIPG